MMQVIKKWRVILYFEFSEKSITFLIHDDHYSNMLRKLNNIDFDIMPTKIEIKLIEENNKPSTSYNQLTGIGAVKRD